jgi:hypothetical protein
MVYFYYLSWCNNYCETGRSGILPRETRKLKKKGILGFFLVWCRFIRLDTVDDVFPGLVYIYPSGRFDTILNQDIVPVNSWFSCHILLCDRHRRDSCVDCRIDTNEKKNDVPTKKCENTTSSRYTIGMM